MICLRLNKLRPSAASQDSGTGTTAKSSRDGFDTSRRGSSGDESDERLRRKRIQIHSLKEIPNSNDGSYNSPDVQFILEVKRSNAKVFFSIWQHCAISCNSPIQNEFCNIMLDSRVRR